MVTWKRRFLWMRREKSEKEQAYDYRLFPFDGAFYDACES